MASRHPSMGQPLPHSFSSKHHYITFYFFGVPASIAGCGRLKGAQSLQHVGQAIPLSFSYPLFSSFRLVTVLHTDNEDNAEAALRILSSPTYASRRGGLPAEAAVGLKEFCVGLIDATQLLLDPIRQEEGYRHGQSASTRPEGLGLASRAPARLLPAVTGLAAAQAEAGETALLRALAPRAWIALQSFPGELLSRVRNRRLYRQYLNGAVAELLALLDLAWAQHPAAVDTTLAQTAEVQLQILLNLPPGAERLRLSILQRLEGGLAAEVRRGAARIGAGPPEGNQATDGSRQQA